MDIEYRRAVLSDLAAIVAFVDYWLTGGGKADGIPNATHDFFVPAGRHESFIRKYCVMLALYEGEIVGWSVKTNKGVLIHLMVAATFRGKGIGGEMLRRMNPEVVRSKFDQKSGDPAGFYRKHGYTRANGERLGKKKNIELFVRANGGEGGGERAAAAGGERFEAKAAASESGGDGRKRTIDAIAKKLGMDSLSQRR